MFNKTVCKSAIIKKAVILTLLSSVFIAGCSSDQNYKREIEGSEDYLKSPDLKPLVIPQGISIPAEIADYYVYTAKTEGAIGRQVDIRPPLIPIPTIADAYATYDKGVVTLTAPVNNGVWNNIPNTLRNNNIPISSSDNNTIQTAKAFIVRGGEEQTVEASFIIQRQVYRDSETITVGLISLTRGAEDLSSNPNEVQRYVIRLFNAIMDDVAPPSSRLPPEKEQKNDGEKKETDKNTQMNQDQQENLKKDDTN